MTRSAPAGLDAALLAVEELRELEAAEEETAEELELLGVLEEEELEAMELAEEKTSTWMEELEAEELRELDAGEEEEEAHRTTAVRREALFPVSRSGGEVSRTAS